MAQTIVVLSDGFLKGRGREDARETEHLIAFSGSRSRHPDPVGPALRRAELGVVGDLRLGGVYHRLGVRGDRLAGAGGWARDDDVVRLRLRGLPHAPPARAPRKRAHSSLAGQLHGHRGRFRSACEPRALEVGHAAAAAELRLRARLRVPGRAHCLLRPPQELRLAAAGGQYHAPRSLIGVRVGRGRHGSRQALRWPRSPTRPQHLAQQDGARRDRRPPGLVPRHGHPAPVRARSRELLARGAPPARRHRLRLRAARRPLRVLDQARLRREGLWDDPTRSRWPLRPDRRAALQRCSLLRHLRLRVDERAPLTAVFLAETRQTTSNFSGPRLE